MHGETIVFAKSELNAYLSRMGILEHEIKLGLYEDFGIVPLSSSEQDDDMAAKISGRSGYIAGNSPRSLLLAVYRSLHMMGCRFLRPGKDGEYVPLVQANEMNISFRETPSIRHRGVCMEGAVSRENILEFIDYLPKVGFNSFFIQFITPFTFYDRWYSHLQNHHLDPTPVTISQVQAYTKEAEIEIKKRGLILHSVGHGWTGECVEIPSVTFDESVLSVPEKYTDYLANIDGKRQMFKNRPIYLNLCYSNPEARGHLVHFIDNYMQAHPELDILQFWLSDGKNAQCECDACTLSPSDYYVLMLNELDALLSRRGDKRRIVFLMYQDTYWAPAREMTQNEDRFILLYAPINRKYTEGIPTQSAMETKPFVLNALTPPANMAENVPYLKKWQQVFHGDCMLFDYHLQWFGYSDIGGHEVAKIIHEDIRQLKKLGLCGLMSCQSQRNFFPTGFAMYIMGHTLWNENIDYEETEKDYYAAAFGKDGGACMAHLDTLSALSHIEYVSCENLTLTDEIKKDFHKMEKVAADFQKVIEANLSLADPCHRLSWYYLKWHHHLAVLTAKYLCLACENHQEEALDIWTKMKEYVQKNEMDVQRIFDVY